MKARMLPGVTAVDRTMRSGSPKRQLGAGRGVAPPAPPVDEAMTIELWTVLIAGRCGPVNCWCNFSRIFGAPQRGRAIALERRRATSRDQVLSERERACVAPRQRLSRWYRRTARLAASAREIPGLRVISPLMSRSTWPSLPRQTRRNSVSACRDVLHPRRSHHHAATTMTPAIAIAETLSMPHLTRRAGASLWRV